MWQGVVSGIKFEKHLVYCQACCLVFGEMLPPGIDTIIASSRTRQKGIPGIGLCAPASVWLGDLQWAIPMV